jgi:hypothetical protein
VTPGGQRGSLDLAIMEGKTVQSAWYPLVNIQNHTKKRWKITIFRWVNQLTIAIFNSYVKLPDISRHDQDFVLKAMRTGDP